MTTAGIDFGTTNSVVSIWTPSGPSVLPIDSPKDARWAELGLDLLMPTVIGLSPEDETVFGWEAKLGDVPTLEAVKRLLLAEEFVELAGKLFVIEEVVTLFFAHLRDQALKLAGADIDRVVVTIPANSRGLARYRTRICAAMAGLEVLALINEPTAAAMAVSRRITHDGKVLVVDLGGGTLDVTLLEACDGVFIEQASSGVPTLGGRDFDSRLAALAVETVSDTDWTASDRRQFAANIERAKILLSTQEFTNIDLPGGESRRITRAAFNDSIRTLVEKLGPAIDECLQAAQMDFDLIDHLLLVGGSCRVPAVRDFVVSKIGKQPSSDVNPMTAISNGAAIAAAILTGELDDNDFFVSTEHALGTIATDDSGTSYFSEIIPRNHKLPASKEQIYLPHLPEQESVAIRVIEGRSDHLDHPDNVILKEWSVALPPPERGDNRQFALQYNYDVNGILHVHARDFLSNEVILDDDVASGVSGDKSKLAKVAKGAREAMATGRLEASTDAAPDDPEAVELIQRANSKVIPFLDDDEANPIRQLVQTLSAATDASARDAAKSDLRKSLSRYSYLF
ncbi:Hsp70 family protein [Gemmatimonas sp.]|uniref:Hsp70 family protein n=1 Tax=Gemmatimonas sp. TaxID=1962908 RepID=UPI0035696324